MTLVAINGAIVPPERAVVSVLDRGFLYGDGVFEVLRTYGGAPFALVEHLDRLARSAARVHMTLPVTCDALAREVRDAIRAAPPGESYVRVMVSRGEGPLGLNPQRATRPTRVILIDPLASPPREVYARGVHAVTVAAERPLPEAKSLGYLASIVLLHEARAKGAAEALLVDARGAVHEGATSNVFVVRDGQLSTPSEGTILAGITRSHVLAAAEALRVEVRVDEVLRASLLAADEVFITSSIRELVPVVAIDAQRIGNGAPGPVTRALHAAFRARAWTRVGASHEDVAADVMPWA